MWWKMLWHISISPLFLPILENKFHIHHLFSSKLVFNELLVLTTITYIHMWLWITTLWITFQAYRDFCAKLNHREESDWYVFLQTKCKQPSYQVSSKNPQQRLIIQIQWKNTETNHWRMSNNFQTTASISKVCFSDLLFKHSQMLLYLLIFIV